MRAARYGRGGVRSGSVLRGGIGERREMTRMRGLSLVALVSVTALALGGVGCGGDDGAEGGTIIRGTTDQPVGYDPAGVYDLPSWDAMVNMYETLLAVPPGGNKPEPEAAESCDYTDDTTYECTLKDGLTFSDGSDLTAEDVVFSFERNVEIADPEGASSLLANMKSVEAPDDSTVVFNLKEPDAIWPYIITAKSNGIVPSDVYPKDELQPSDQVVGSGPYTLAEYEPGQQTVLEVNPEYTGENQPENDRVIVQYFDKASALKLAVEQGDVDFAYRSLSPTDIEDLRDTEGLEVVEGSAVEIRYIVFNLDLQPGETDEEKLAVRRAVAYTVDREAIAENVYAGTVEPLYSMVPQDLEFATQPFLDEYGESPDVDAARQELEDAGVDTPVDLELWYTPAHYGAASGDEYAEIKHQLEDSGLFTVPLKSSAWTQYQEAALEDKYPQYQFGWFPDFPDADNYVSSFYAKTAFLNSHYSNPEMDRLLAEERAETDEATRAAAFEQIQQLGAEEGPTIPVWEAKQIAVVRDGVDGVEETLDPAFLTRYWVISKD
jgi:peptide/nickel transport system substrate-binding protein